MTRLVVEAGFGYAVTASTIVWTDITQYVDTVQGVQISRGASDELAQVQPGTCRLTLDNSDGRFTPTHSGSPYYPNVLKNTPLRVREVSAGTNLITNPSFESGLTDWQASASPTIAVSTTHVQHGTQSMLLTFAATTTGQNALTTIYGLTIGQTYTYSAYVWVPTGDIPVYLQVTSVANSSVSTVNDAFQRLSVTFTATATSHIFRVIGSGTPAAGDQVWIDAVQLEEGSSATTFDSDAAQVHGRFFGMVNEWPIAWTGLQSTVTITATDMHKWLSRLPALQPMLVEEMLQNRPAAYYPMGESSDSTTLGDVSGYGRGHLAVFQAGTGGTIEFGAGGGPIDSLGCPKFTPASASNGKYLRASLGSRFTAAANDSSGNMFIEFWFSTAVADYRYLLSLSTTDGRHQLAFQIGNLGDLWVNLAVDSVFSTTADKFGTGYADGAVHHVVADLAAGQIWIDGVSKGTGSLVQAPSDPALLWLGAQAPSRTTDGKGLLWDGTIAQVAIYLGTGVTAADLTAHYTTGTTEHIGETADNRLSRIAGYAGINLTTSGTVFGGVASQKALGKSPLEHMREIELTEAGRLITSRSTNQLIFQSRDVRYSPAAATIGYADLETSQVEMADDDQKMVNTVTAIRPGGATQKVTDQTARDLHGPYEQQATYFKDDDQDVLYAAQWVVSRYADPPPELRQLPVEAYTLPLATYRALLDADISSAITVTGMPSQAPATSETVSIEGYTETIRHRQHLLDFHTSRAASGTVWVLNDTTYSVLGTSTRLAY